MADTTVFISYSHKDMETFDWLNRLKLFLNPLQRRYPVNIWADTDIPTGSDWRTEIEKRLAGCIAAVLLVGPGFLGSNFITTVEVPALLTAQKVRGIMIYPIVVDNCLYTLSELSAVQAFNDPAKPLRFLRTEDREGILAKLGTALAADLRRHQSIGQLPQSGNSNIKEAMVELRKIMHATWAAFNAQINRREELKATIERRLGILDDREYEKFFFHYYNQMNEDERFEFKMIRAITEGALHDGNQHAFEIFEANPRMFDELPQLSDLHQHLAFWLNKYNLIFAQEPKMCLLYTGVEDGLPFPRGIEARIDDWLAAHP